MPVPYTFGTATAAIPLSQLDSNFATAITLGNTAVYLGNTTTSLGNVTLTNVTISSGNVTVSNITANAVTSPTATNLTLQSAGTTAVTIDTSQNVGIGTTSPSQKLQVSGNVRATAFYVDGAAYVGTAGSDTLTFIANAAERMRIDSAGNVGIGTTSPSSALTIGAGGIARFNRADNVTYNEIKYVTSGDQFYFNQANGGVYTFNITGSEKMRIDSSGNLLVGQTGTTGRIGVTSTTTDSSAYGIYIQDSASALMFYVRNDGVVSTGAKTASPYNNTTASAANMFVSSAGILQRSTSSLKYKTDVQDATHGLVDALKLRAVTYKGKNDGKTIFGGLIAEEVHEAGLTEFVQYAEDGSPDALNYGNMVSLAFKAIQEQQALIQSLTIRLTALEAK
jgi:hypothetical protein